MNCGTPFQRSHTILEGRNARTQYLILNPTLQWCAEAAGSTRSNTTEEALVSDRLSSHAMTHRLRRFIALTLGTSPLHNVPTADSQTDPHSLPSTTSLAKGTFNYSTYIFWQWVFFQIVNWFTKREPGISLSKDCQDISKQKWEALLHNVWWPRREMGWGGGKF